MVSTSMVYGCIIDVFNTENISAQGICSEKLPEFKEVAPGHCCACHFAEPFPIKESHIDL